MRLKSTLPPSLPLVAMAFGLASCGAESNESSGASDLILGGEVAMAATPDVVETATVIDLEPAQLVERLTGGNVQLIDVRTAEEFAEGHLAGAINISSEGFDPKALPDTQGKEVILYCRSGRRSGIVGERLAEHTGKPAEHLGEGIIAWRAAGLPTTDQASAE